jgi:O-antigen ligase
LVVLNILYWKYSGIKSIWDKLLGIPFITVAAGTPIIFTSLTRSVFEVSKLLNLRLALIFIAVVVLLRAVLTKEKIKFIKTPLNWALLAYTIVNIISTLLSSNKYIAILGAYDRWDGLLTEINYVLFILFYINFVKNKKTFYWLLGVLLVGSVLSAIYGIFQSFGIDFMHWSVNPTSRVFACINNPVHYSPYIIMHVPLLAGFIYFLVNFLKIDNLKLNLSIDRSNFFNGLKDFFKLNKNVLIINSILVCLVILHYSGNFLSFGRAAWVGFSLAMTYFLCFIFDDKTDNIVYDSIFIAIGSLLFNALYVFKIYMASSKSLILLALISAAYLFMMFRNKNSTKKYLLYSILILFAGYVQFTAVSIYVVLLELALIFVIRKYFYEGLNNLDKFLKSFIFWMLILVVIIPSLRNIYASAIIQYNIYKNKAVAINPLQSSKIVLDETRKLAQKGVISSGGGNVFFRTQTYASAYTEGTARTSMWKSGLVWWTDGPRNFFFGTGPGTIKEFYPVYRRTDYGRLEGGHNFTPDQLHNDYINILATRGLFGFLTYFVWLIPLGMLMMLGKLKNEGLKPANYILVGLFSGLFVYLGQTMFNFGVVATRIIFYEYFCLGLVMVLHDPFKTKN